MFDLLGTPQLYATGLILAVIWLVILLEPGIQRLVSIVLQNRAAAWRAQTTVLLQAMCVLSSAILIVNRLGMKTRWAVFAALLLWLVAASVNHDSALRTWVALLRRPAKAQDSAPATIPPVPSPTPNDFGHSLPESAVISTVGQSSMTVIVETKAAPSSPMPAPASAPNGDVASVTPVLVDAPHLTVEALNRPLRRKPALLLRRQPLGKKTTANFNGL